MLPCPKQHQASLFHSTAILSRPLWPGPRAPMINEGPSDRGRYSKARKVRKMAAEGSRPELEGP